MVTNLTGHPAVILPNGFRDDGTPVSLTFLGNLYGEAPMLALARVSGCDGFHRKHPPGVHAGIRVAARIAGLWLATVAARVPATRARGAFPVPA